MTALHHRQANPPLRHEGALRHTQIEPLDHPLQIGRTDTAIVAQGQSDSFVQRQFQGRAGRDWRARGHKDRRDRTRSDLGLRRCRCCQ
ncbi:hypothetical protein D3C85_943360 [compost metagenome]